MIQQQIEQNMLWTLRDIKRAVGVSTSGANFDINGVSIDSRTTQKDDLFIAIKGLEADGHQYVQSAYEKGASVAVVDHRVECDIEQIIVPDTLKALWDLGASQRTHAHATRVAVTGSCGKTTVKEMLGAVLKAHKSERSYNNKWGVPLSLARMNRESKIGVFEVGMNHPGEIAPLSELVRPHIAVVTNVAPVHIGAFEDVREIAIEKLSIQKGLVEGGKLVTSTEVYNTYPEYFDAKPLLFSVQNDGDADVYAEKVTQSVTGQNVVANVFGKMVSFRLHLFGEHAVYNALAALTVAAQLNADMNMVVAALESLQPFEGRGNVHEMDGVYVVDESYNANPASMRASINTLLNRPGKGRRIAILGQMGELGHESENYHRDLADVCEELDTLITVGEGMKVLHDQFKNNPEITTWHVSEQSDLNLDKFVNQLELGDIVMVKGSKVVFWKYRFVGRLVKAIQKHQQGK